MNGRHLQRHIWLLVVFTGVIFLLLSRLAYIQLVGTESFSRHDINLIKQAVGQRQQQLVLDSGRGAITDRHGHDFTSASIYVLVLYPVSKQVAIDETQIEKVAEQLQLTPEEFMADLETVQEPSVYHQGGDLLRLTEQQAEEINRLDIPGILGVPYELRYDDEQLAARHLIGFIGENAEWVKAQYAEELRQGWLEENSLVGISGLERTFESFLQGMDPTTLSYFVDGQGNLLQGMGIKYSSGHNPFYPLNVQTTLDFAWQRAVENALDRRGIEEGTALILDIDTREILAMASRPQVVDTTQMSEAWENKALVRYAPGSVFKIVTAAAALEEGLAEFGQTFTCAGVLEGTPFHCWQEEGHGQLTFEQAFAESCNIVFGQLAEQLGAERLTAYAEKLGLLDRVGWSTEELFHLGSFAQLADEQVGQVFHEFRTAEELADPNYLRQTGIGQLDVQVTPLAVANMLATIANGGHRQQVKVVNEITYETGGTFYRFQDQEPPGETISAYTAYQLQRLLAQVVDRGTAGRLSEKDWQAAGKTGTAELAPESAQANGGYIHHWFAGYFPQQTPRYVIVVLNLNQDSGTKNRAIDVFGDVADWVYHSSGVKF